MTEPRENRLKRLKMRSMRRGIKEMDLILQRFADGHLDGFDDAQLDHYDALLSENDHDLYQWVTGQSTPPEAYSGVIEMITAGLHRT